MKRYLGELITGRIDKIRIRPYLLSLQLLFLSSLLLSELFFPGGYDPRRNFISDHGWISQNPQGSYFFIIGIGFTGILLIPYLLLIFQRTKHISKPLSLLALLVGILGSVGFSMVGLFPKGGAVKDFHDLGADLAWYGFLTSMLSTSFVLGLSFLKGNKFPNLPGFILLEGIVFIIGINVFIIENESLRQWTAFMTVFVWLIGIYFLLPGQPTNDKI